LVSDGYIDFEISNHLKSNVIQKAIRPGYDDKLYKPSSKEKNIL